MNKKIIKHDKKIVIGKNRIEIDKKNCVNQIWIIYGFNGKKKLYVKKNNRKC